MSLENARKIVHERGARLLDSVRPGWFREVEPDELNGRDIITLLYGGFWGAISEIGLQYPPMDYGFDEGIAEPDEITQAWQEAIIKRRATALPSVFD